MTVAPTINPIIIAATDETEKNTGFKRSKFALILDFKPAAKAIGRTIMRTRSVDIRRASSLTYVPTKTAIKIGVRKTLSTMEATNKVRANETSPPASPVHMPTAQGLGVDATRIRPVAASKFVERILRDNK
jgi:hypothetical protein